MTDKDDFASMMSSLGGPEQRTRKRVRRGDIVEGTVVQIGRESVFVDLGLTTEGRLDRAQLEDKSGELKLEVGDKIRASVASTDDVAGPLLVLALGRGKGGGIGASALQSAVESKIPVEGKVTKAVKAGLEVEIAGIRAFCPASHVDLRYVSDLSSYEGQTLDFRVLEIKEGGQSIVVSRKVLLEEQKQQVTVALLERLHVGGDFEGAISSVQKYGAFVELGGGVEGLLHISEVAHGRVDRVEDVLSVGDKVTVRVLSIEPQEKGPVPRLRLSLKAREAAPESPTPEPGEVLTGTVDKVSSFGVFITTNKGTGLVPIRELGIPRGADYRKAFPPGKEVKVVLVSRNDKGQITFSMSRVAGVEERQNYREFTQSGKAEPSQESMGSLGDLLRSKLGLAAEAPAGEASTPQVEEPSTAPVSAASQAVPPPPPSEEQQAPRNQASDSRSLPDGMIRRRH